MSVNVCIECGMSLNVFIKCGMSVNVCTCLSNPLGLPSNILFCCIDVFICHSHHKPVSQLWYWLFCQKILN